MPTARPFTTLISACAVFVAVALPPRAAPSAQSGQQPAPPAPLKTLNVNVTDEKGSFVKGLGREAFVVFDGKQRREIVTFEQRDAPATVGILLDTSGSMYAREGNKSSRLRHVRNALVSFLGDANPSNEYFLVAFNQHPQLLLAGTTDTGEVVSALDRLDAANLKGQTALYDALYVALNKEGENKHRRRSILFISDGQDNASQYTFAEVMRIIAESDASLYAIGLVEPHDDSSLGFSGRAILKDLAESSGGMAFFARNPRELEAALGMIADALRSQYSLGFAPAPAAKKDGWHDLKIKLAEQRDERGKKLKLSLHARKGFYESAPRR